MDSERGVYDKKKQLKKVTFKYEQKGNFCLGAAKAESKEDETITGNSCPVFDYTGKKTVMIDAYKK